jgi:hypothetical protein
MSVFAIAIKKPPEPGPPVYDAQYGMPFTEYGDDDMNFTTVGDIHQQENVGRWGKWYSTPTVTGSGIVLDGTDGILKSESFLGPYDVRFTVNNTVFSFPDNYAYVYVFLRSWDKYQYAVARFGGNYPNNILLTGAVRSYSSTYDANNGTLAEIPAGQIIFRLVNYGPPDWNGRVYFWNYAISDWQQLFYRGSGHPNEPVVPGVLVTRNTNNPPLTINMATYDITTYGEPHTYFPETFRLGQNTYRKVRGRFQYSCDLTGSEDNGIVMEHTPAGDNHYHMYITDPAPEELDADEAWTVEAKWRFENWNDSRAQAFFEIGHYPDGYRGYDINWAAAIYEQNDSIGNFHFGNDLRSGFRLEWNGTYNRVDWKRWNDAGVYAAGGNVAHSDGLRGVFKCINNGAGSFQFYFGLDSADTLIYTWTPTNWETAGYPNGQMYIGLGYTDGYANCDCRWYYCTINGE